MLLLRAQVQIGEGRDLLVSQGDYPYSDFCGSTVCKTCLVKQRPYQQMAHLSDMTAIPTNFVRGSACIVCDRKHYIRSMLAATKDTIEAS